MLKHLHTIREKLFNRFTRTKARSVKEIEAALVEIANNPEIEATPKVFLLSALAWVIKARLKTKEGTEIPALNKVVEYIPSMVNLVGSLPSKQPSPPNSLGGSELKHSKSVKSTKTKKHESKISK